MRGVSQETTGSIKSPESNTTSSNYIGQDAFLLFTVKCKTNLRQEKLMDTGEGNTAGEH